MAPPRDYLLLGPDSADPRRDAEKIAAKHQKARAGALPGHYSPRSRDSGFGF